MTSAILWACLVWSAGMTQAAPQAISAAQAAPFVGEWTITASSPMGQTNYHVAIAPSGDSVRATIKTADQPDTAATDLRLSGKSLVLRFITTFAGTPIPT